MEDNLIINTCRRSLAKTRRAASWFQVTVKWGAVASGVPQGTKLGYLTCIRPLLEYCARLYHHALPDYLSDDIERVQKRALSIISPGLSYLANLSLFNLNSLKDRRTEQCNKFFEPIVSNTEHKLHHFLPLKNYITYNHINQRQSVNPVMRAKRFSQTYLPAICRQ